MEPTNKEVSNCVVCDSPVSGKELEDSLKKHAFHVCYKCQRKATQKIDEYKYKINSPTEIQALLYYALLDRNIDAEFEYSDGKKSVDIAILPSKIYIEIDGMYHTHAEQILRDFQREYYSFKNGYLTLHILNKTLQEHFRSVVKAIKEIAKMGSNLKNDKDGTNDDSGH